MEKKILIIDDEELIIKSFTKLLEKNGYNVFVAKKGEDALVISEEEDFDLIIVDIKMPGINGVETVKSLYELKGKKTPTIFISGYAEDELQKQAEALNPVAYINKPFDISELMNKIKEVIG